MLCSGRIDRRKTFTLAFFFFTLVAHHCIQTSGEVYTTLLLLLFFLPRFRIDYLYCALVFLLIKNLVAVTTIYAWIYDDIMLISMLTIIE
jgi:hypothetical protein